MSESRLVPYSTPLDVGQVGQHSKSGTKNGTDAVPPDWEALYSKHLRRDRKRDSDRDSLSHPYGTGAGQVGQENPSPYCRDCQFDADCTPNGAAVICLHCKREITPCSGCCPAVSDGEAGRTHLDCVPGFSGSGGASRKPAPHN